MLRTPIKPAHQMLTLDKLDMFRRFFVPDVNQRDNPLVLNVLPLWHRGAYMVRNWTLFPDRTHDSASCLGSRFKCPLAYLIAGTRSLGLSLSASFWSNSSYGRHLSIRIGSLRSHFPPGWVIFAIIWQFFALGAVVVYLMYDGRSEISRSVRGILNNRRL